LVEYIEVILFIDSGKYYTTEDWKVPEDAIGPADMKRSYDFRRIGEGKVLIPDTKWGYPCLL